VNPKSRTRLDRWITLNVVRPTQKVGIFNPRVGIPIMMYHSVSDNPEPGVHPYYRMTIPPGLFSEQMKWLHDAGYKALSMDQLLGFLRSEKQQEEKFVVLTFDDAYRDFLTEAWPILQDYGFTATVFVSTGMVGKTFLGRECLTWKEIRELYLSGVSFGSHTVHHAELSELDWPDIERELSESKKRLEDELVAEVRNFCYPYAYPEADKKFRKRLNGTLIQQGYESCTTTLIGRISLGDDPFLLRRLPANGADDLEIYRAKIDGYYDWLAVPQSLLKRLKNWVYWDLPK